MHFRLFHIFFLTNLGNQSPSLGKINPTVLSLFEVVQRVRRLLDDGDAHLLAHGDDVAVANLFFKISFFKKKFFPNFAGNLCTWP